MRKIKLFDNESIKNVGMIISGTVFAQLLNVIISPVLTRIYSPEAYGVFSIFNSLVAILSVSASLDYQNAIPLEKDDDDANSLTILSFILLCGICIIVFFVLLIKGDLLLDMINYSSIIKYKYFLCLGILFTGLYNILMQTAYRASSFKVIAKTKYVQSISANMVKVVFGLALKSPIGMVLGAIIGQSAGITSLFSISHTSLKKWRWSNDIFTLARKHKKFPLFSAPNNYINSLSNQLPVLMLSTMYSSSYIGAFSLANQIVALPAIFIGTAVGQVFYSRISKFDRKDVASIRRECMSVFFKICIFGGIVFILLALIFPLIAVPIFGSEWELAGKLSRILCLNSFGAFMVIPVSRVLEIVNQQQISLIINAVRIVFLYITFKISCLLSLEVESTVLIFSIVSFIFYVLLIVSIFRELSIKERNR